MGYRSEVAYVIKFDDKQTRDAYVTLMLAHDKPEVRKAIEECDYEYEQDPIITFQADDVKWYYSYEEVKAHKFIYTNAFELQMGSYRFIALGEDGQETFEEEELDNHWHDLSDYIYTEHHLRINF